MTKVASLTTPSAWSLMGSWTSQTCFEESTPDKLFCCFKAKFATFGRSAFKKMPQTGVQEDLKTDNSEHVEELLLIGIPQTHCRNFLCV